MLEATRRRTEAVLTPKQLAELKEAIFRAGPSACMARCNRPSGVVGLPTSRKVAVERVHEDDMNHRDPFFVLDPARKSFDLLTPQQQEKRAWRWSGRDGRPLTGTFTSSSHASTPHTKSSNAAPTIKRLCGSAIMTAMTNAIPKSRWYRSAPDRFLTGLLGIPGTHNLIH